MASADGDELSQGGGPPVASFSSSTTESVLKGFFSSPAANLTMPPPRTAETVNLAAVMAKMEVHRTLASESLPMPLAPELPRTADLFSAAVGGLWCWILFLVFLYRGLCIKSKLSVPVSLLPAHNLRTITLLVMVLVQMASVAEAGWRYRASQDPHGLLLPAAIISLFTTLMASSLYHATERWHAPGYVWVCLFVWIFQVALGMWRVWQMAAAGVKMTLVYPCLTYASTIAAALLVSMDLYTAVLWTYRQRRCEVLEITPGLEETGVGSSSGDGDSSSTGRDAVGEQGSTASGGGPSAGITYAHPRCSLPSRATFLWFLHVLTLGWKRPLEFTDLGKLPKEEESTYQYERFHRCYNEQKMAPTEDTPSSQTPDGGEGVSLWKVFFLVYWREMLVGGVLKFLGDAANYIGALAISFIVTFVSSVQAGDRVTEGDVVQGLYYVGWGEVVTNGWVVACVALVASLAQSTFSQASTHLVAMEGIHVKAALQAMVYHKSLRLPSSSSAENNGHEEEEEENHTGQRGDSNSSSSSSSSSPFGCRNSGHAGVVINLSSEDADNVMTFFMHCHYIWAIPLKIAVILVLLWCQLGMAAVVAAVVGILCLTPLQFFLCKNIAAVNKNFLSVSDERLRQTHELVTGVKLVKLHAWEDVFVKRITKVREEELGLLYRDSILRALMTFLTQGSGVVVSLVTFGLYSPLEGVALEPSRVFSGLALFQQLTVPLFILPIIVSHSIRAKNSAQRLREFLSLPEVEGPQGPRTPLLRGIRNRLSKRGKTPRNSRDCDKAFRGTRFSQLDQVLAESRPTSTCSNLSNDSAWSSKKGENGRNSSYAEACSSDSEEEREFEQWLKRKSVLENDSKGCAVTLHNGSFAWDSRKKLPVLEDINVSIPSGRLTVVIGKVGSGKTSLLQALLGEMVTLKGQLKWAGETSIAYVSQHPWLLNATLRDNVLFGRRLLTKRYHRVLQACALKPDIEILPAGDQTEIGERGINLSGGQRQRIAIARALYSDARTVIMDSPFSALDRGVAAQVWEEGILKLLLSRRRTVILATHLTHFTRHADKVLYLEEGKIKHQGSPKEIAASLPFLWKEWSSEDPLGTTERAKRLEGRTARERWKLLRTVTRISIQRASMSRASRREGREESKEPHYCDSPVRHYSINRQISHSALLPGDECEYLPSLTPPLPRHKVLAEKKPLFRIKSSAPALGRKGSKPPQKFPPRHSKSLPPQPRPLPRMRSSPAVVVPQGNMLQRLFSSASIRSNKKPSTSTSDKWHLGRILTSNNLGEEDLEEDLELEEEVPLDDDFENGKLMSEEERERGKISKWNYVVYMRACGLGLCLSYLFCAFAGQGVSVGLDFWLEKWSGQANSRNASQMDGRRIFLQPSAIESEQILPGITNVKTNVHNVTESDNDFVMETMQHHYPIYAVLSLASIVLSLFTNLLGQVAAGKGRKKIHQDMLRNIVSCSVRFFDVTPAGRIMNRFTTDTAMIDKELARSVTHLLFFVLLVTSAVVVNAIITPIFLVVAVPICFVYYAIQKFFRCSSRELKRLESLSRSPLYSHMSESVSGAVVIRAYGDQRRFTDVLLHRLDTHVLAFTILHAGNRWLGISLDYIGGIIVFLATLASLLWSTVFGDLSPAKVGLAISYTLLVPVYLNWVVRFLADTEMCLNAVERVHQYTVLDSEEKPYSKKQRSITPAGNEQDVSGISSISYRAYSTLKPTGLPSGWPLEGRVEFQDVSLTYDRTLEPVLSELNFTIKSGEKVGLCGRTGSGKSSLILSLYRLVETLRGRIFIDGTDISHVPLATLRGSISVIPQDTHLFCGTVRFNLDPLEQHPDEHLWRALEIAQLKQLITSMPGGLGGEVAEGGSNFSAGQRQLFCVARAVLRKSSLLILDEATSALDASTERSLHHALETAFSHATVITIAHGVNSLLEYPRILVLENGKLVEDGNPRELATKENGAFAKLLKAASESSKA